MFDVLLQWVNNGTCHLGLSQCKDGPGRYGDFHYKIKMVIRPSYLYKYKTVVRLSHLYNGKYLYW